MRTVTELERRDNGGGGRRGVRERGAVQRRAHVQAGGARGECRSAAETNAKTGLEDDGHGVPCQQRVYVDWAWARWEQ